MLIYQTKIFGKQKKKLHPHQISALNEAIMQISANPNSGDPKKGDLQGVRVYKFIMVKQECLLAYTASDTQISLLSLGTHENFYRDLKKIV